MTVMLDIVMATVLLGMIILTVMNININLADENYKGMVELNTQTETIQLARIIEHDIYKVGYRVAKPAMMIADTSEIKFKTNLGDATGVTDIVQYGLGGAVLNSNNPRDRMLFRIENVTTVYINYSVVKFKLSYYDSTDVAMATPITGAALNNIRSIKVLLKLESPEPFDTTRTGGKQYASAQYQKLIYPRNLQ
jgi:hypothetical protein